MGNLYFDKGDGILEMKWKRPLEAIVVVVIVVTYNVNCSATVANHGLRRFRGLNRICFYRGHIRFRGERRRLRQPSLCKYTFRFSAGQIRQVPDGEAATVFGEAPPPRNNQAQFHLDHVLGPGNSAFT